MHFLERLSQYLVLLGLPGLFLIALLDSAAVPMVGGPDAILILLSWRYPHRLAALVVAAAAGSTIGCLILYRIARMGGQLALAKLATAKRDRVMRLIERNSVWAVFGSVMMPPPFPTKPVILAAGAFGAPLFPFTVAVVAGRLVRYLVLAWLGARFGNQAAQVVRAHYPAILVALAGIALTTLLIRRLRRPKPGAE